MSKYSFEESFSEIVKVTNQVSNAVNSKKVDDLTVDAALDMLLSLIEELKIACEELQQQNEDLVISSELILDQKNMFEKLFEYSPTPYVTTNNTTVIKSINQAAANLIGMNRSITNRKPLAVYISRDKRTQFFEFVNSIVTGHTKLIEFESKIQPRNGHSRTVIVNVCTSSSLKDNLLWTFQDIVQRKALIEEENQTNLLELLPALTHDLSFPNIQTDKDD